jgi:hypothetical protein
MDETTISNLQQEIITKFNIIEAILFTNNIAPIENIRLNLETILRTHEEFNNYINTRLVGMLFQYEISSIINLYFDNAYDYYKNNNNIHFKNETDSQKRETRILRNRVFNMEVSQAKLLN